VKILRIIRLKTFNDYDSAPDDCNQNKNLKENKQNKTEQNTVEMDLQK
jgi:hypothetical protein